METSSRVLGVGISVVILASPALGQDREFIADLSEEVEQELSSIYRYDSDISVSSGVWLSRFIHLKLDPGIAMVTVLEFDPRLLAQVAEAIESSEGAPGHGTVEFRQQTFDVAACEDLAARIDSLKTAIVKSAESIGSRAAAPERNEIIVDGRYRELKVRINRYFQGTFGVSENDERLYPPIDALERGIAECTESTSWELMQHDF